MNDTIDRMAAQLLLRVQAQSAMFCERPSRLRLLEAAAPLSTGLSFSVNVWRNHAFEPVQSVADSYLKFRGLKADFRIGNYDDSLTFSGWEHSHVEVLWVDASRYSGSLEESQWTRWLSQRVIELRRRSGVPILVLSWTEGDAMSRLVRELDGLPGVHAVDVQETCLDYGVKLLDRRTSQLSGTRLSSAAQFVLGREFATRWLAASILPPVKAVVMDLDNTLHAGVLGEDGIGGVALTPAHRELQRYLLGLRDRGIFLGLASRRLLADVQSLFSARRDFPLQLSDFSAVHVSWGDKGGSLRRIAHELRIAPDAMVFVDDNPGELAAALAACPELLTIRAAMDASETQRALEFCPGLWRWRTSEDDIKRLDDLAASAQRARIAAGMSAGDYLAELDVTLSVSVDRSSDLRRLADLCLKTNQFNLALRRLTEADLAERIKSPGAAVIGVRLRDKLSDSGLIAVIVTSREEDSLLVEELCISCRALGRDLEDTMILGALQQLPGAGEFRELIFNVAVGPRNAPAREWLSRMQAADSPPDSGLHRLPASTALNFQPVGRLTLVAEV